MSDKLVNSFIASIIGCISAAVTVWFLLGDTVSRETTSPVPQTQTQAQTGRFATLVVDRLQINDRLVVVDGQTGTPLIEFKDGNVYVQHGLYSNEVGTTRLVSQKVQVTPDDPIERDPAIFAELAVNRDRSPYFALLSRKKAHSINVGFDNAETGFIISQNNVHAAIQPQVIMPIPQPQEQPQPQEPGTPRDERTAVAPPTAPPR